MEKLNKTFVKGTVLKADELNEMVIKTNELIDSVDDKIGATYFDATTFRQLQFRTEQDKIAWLNGGGDGLILRSDTFSFSGTVTQVKITDEYGTKQLYFTNVAPTAMITVGFRSQTKGITDLEWTEVFEDFVVNVAVDRASKGTYTPIITNQNVPHGDLLTFDVKKYLASGDNRVRITATGVTTNETATVIYNATLTSMYLSAANFVWHKPFIENESFELGGMNIGGNLSKKVKVRVTNGKGYIADYEDNIGSSTYTTTEYFFRKLGFPTAGTGTYQVEIWIDANGLESEHLVYNIMCIAQTDKTTAQAICINDIDNAVNGGDSQLFRYSTYNKGQATASPSIRIEKNGTIWKEETLSDVPTSSAQSYAATLEFEDENPTFNIYATGILGDAVQIAEIVVDNSASFPAVSGVFFYMSAANRSNVQSNRESIVNEISKNEYQATWTNVAWVDGMDGWTTDSEGRKCLLIPASCKGEIKFQPLASIGNGKTIEICYRVKSAADYNENVITIAANPTSDTFQGIRIKPKKISVYSRDKKVEEEQSYPMEDEVLVHVLVTIVKNYKTNYGNLCQIYVNGGKKCSFEFSSTDSFNANANIILGSETADLCVYKMRVYESGFEWVGAAQNYVNCLPDKASKTAAWTKILEAMDDNYKVDYDKVYGKRNTMVIEMRDGAVLPNLLNPAGGYCDYWVNIIDPIEGELDADFVNLFNGSKIENQFIEGQGTTAMTYFRWNFRWKMDKAYNKRRITAKKNVASSMQDHKMGATRLYNDLHDACVGQNELGTRVAVFQYPVYGFLKQLIDGTEDQYTYTFIGLYTIGPDKGDKNYFGFNDKRVEKTIMHLEGTDHTPTGVGMEYPWSETRFDASREAMGGILSNTSIEAAWEVGAAGELSPDESSDQQGVQDMLNDEFKPGYEATYNCSTFIEGVSESLATINANPLVFRNAHSGKEVWTDGVYDLYYYNIENKKYQSNGVNLLSQLDISVSELSGKTIAEKNEIFKAKRREKFVADMGKYWHKADAIFHYTFCLMFAATDNFKKNTYPYKYYQLAQGGLWRWRQDDLDSILDINNQGFSAKLYSVLVGDVTATGSGSVFRGDNSVFWTLIKECFQEEIKAMVHSILDKMIEFAPSGQTKLERCVSYFKSLFWDKAQEYFGVGSYNMDAEWTYEEAWYQRTIGAYTNDVHPLAQSLGSHYEAEKDWVALRFAFLMSYYSYGAFSTDSGDDTSMGQISFRATGGKTYKITPALDFNPTILVGQSSMVSAEDRIKAGDTVEIVVPDMGSNDTHIYIQGTDYYSSIGDLADLQVTADNPVLTVSSKRLRSLKVGDELANKVTSNVATLTIGACPSLESVDARNLSSLRSSVNLTQCTRLKEVLFSGTNTPNVSIPTGSKLHTLSLPSTITTLSLLKLRNLNDFTLDGLSSLSYLRLEDNPSIDNFAILKKAYQESDDITNIRVLGFNALGGALDIDMFINLADKCYGIDAEGNATSEKPVIEGTLSIDNAYRDSFELVKNNYPKLDIILTGSFYIRFADPEVLRVLMANNVGDSFGISEEAASSLSGIGHFFKGNTVLKSFNELNQFTKIKGIIYDAFRDCVNLKSINVENITSIESSAFIGSGITSIVAPNVATLNSQIMRDCKSLEYADFSGAKGFQNGSIFKDCINLKRVKIGPVTQIPSSVFYGCISLEEIDMDFSLIESLGSAVFFSNRMLSVDLNFPKLKGDILSSTFSWSGIKSLSMPKVTKINAYACREAKSLKTLNIDGVSLIGEESFLNCESLKTVSAENLEEVGKKAFYGCGSLASFNAYKLKSISAGAFANCSSLHQLDLSKVTSIGGSALYLCSKLSGDIVLHELKDVSLGGYTFRRTNISSFNAQYITGIGNEDFYGCPSLKKVDIGANVSSIGNSAFGYSSVLVSFVCRALVPPTLGSNVFHNTGGCIFYVPEESVEAYKSATGWSSLASRIKPLSEYVEL